MGLVVFIDLFSRRDRPVAAGPGRAPQDPRDPLHVPHMRGDEPKAQSMSMTPEHVGNMESDLKDLIAVPRETLEIELKAWLDLNDSAVRANIARHLAALANHGGGYLIFGFNDDLSHDQNRPDLLKNYNRDVFAGIVSRYLTPTFQCEVAIVQDKSGEQFPVIRVPGHGRVPIAAKADGPKDNKGRIQGINASTYYIRKPGPQSAPIIGGEEWGPLIRRCVLNDRDRLLSDIAGLVQAPEKSEPAVRQRLEKWHKEAEKRFLQCLSQANGLSWPVSIEENRYQLSYLISSDGDEDLPTDSLSQILKEVNNEVRNTVWTGWSMFYPFSEPEVAPVVYPEQLDGTGGDVIEANLMGDRDFDTTLPDFWRVAPDGRVTLIRAYREDRQRSVMFLNRAAGTWLSPETVIRETTELVAHARSLARRFETATKVSFQCSWIGLKDRQLDDFDSSIYWSPIYIAGAEQRTTKGEWKVAKLGAAWSSVVAELSCPILRLFRLGHCTQAFVEGMAPGFVKL